MIKTLFAALNKSLVLSVAIACVFGLSACQFLGIKKPNKPGAIESAAKPAEPVKLKAPDNAGSVISGSAKPDVGGSDTDVNSAVTVTPINAVSAVKPDESSVRPATPSENVATIAITGKASGKSGKPAKEIIKSRSIEFHIQVKKDDKVIEDASVRTVDGVPTPFSYVQSLTYKAAADRAVDGSIKFIPGVVDTGFFANLVPKISNDGVILTKVDITISELAEMKSIEDRNGFFIDAPDINRRQMSDTILFKEGKTILILVGNYSIEITAKVI